MKECNEGCLQATVASFLGLPKCFGFELDIKKGIFPYYLCQAKYFGVILPNAPHEKYFGLNSKKPDQYKEAKAFIAEIQNQPYDFNQNIVDYCLDDCKILAKGFARFIESSLQLTSINPLSACTLA